MEADHHSAEAKTIQLENSSHPKRSDKSQTKYCQQKAGKSRQNKYRLISAKADITGTSRHPVHHWNIRESCASVEHQDILDITGTSGHHSSITQSKQAIWSITHIFCKIKSSKQLFFVKTKTNKDFALIANSLEKTTNKQKTQSYFLHTFKKKVHATRLHLSSNYCYIANWSLEQPDFSEPVETR